MEGYPTGGVGTVDVEGPPTGDTWWWTDPDVGDTLRVPGPPPPTGTTFKGNLD